MRKLLKWTAVCVGVVALLVFVFFYAKAQTGNDFLSCDAMALDHLKVEQAHSTIRFSDAEQNAIVNAETDACMKSRGHEYVGGADAEFCRTERNGSCYSSKPFGLSGL
jgi:hypothetical protein